MAVGIKTEKENNRASIAKHQQHLKRLEWCFKDKEVERIYNALQDKGRILPQIDSKTGEPSLENNTLNISRLIIALHKEDSSLYVYAEQISESLKLDLEYVKTLFFFVKKSLLKIEGYALRNLHAVGYRIASYNDLLLESNKSIYRIAGVDFNAVKNIFNAVRSLELKAEAPRFSDELRNIQQNFLVEISQCVDAFNAEIESLKEKYPEFKSFEKTMSADARSSNRPPGA